MKPIAILYSLAFYFVCFQVAASDDNSGSDNENWDAIQDWTGDGTIDSRDVEFYYTNHSEQGSWPQGTSSDGSTFFIFNPNYEPSTTDDRGLTPYTFESPKYIKLIGSINFDFNSNVSSDGTEHQCDVGELTVGC